MTIQGDLVRLRGHADDYPVLGRGKRGDVVTFSKAARKRMLETVATIDWRHLTDGIFVTLTYPPEKEARNNEMRNRDRYLFMRNMENYLGRRVSALWRVEWKVRQSGPTKGKLAPHFHLIVFGTPFVPKELIRQWWGSALQHTGPLATDVRDLTKKRMHQVYIAKYCAKLPEASTLDYVTYLNIRGRHWGIHRRVLLPRETRAEYVDLPIHLVHAFRKAAAGLLPWYDPEYDPGFAIFGPMGRRIGEEMRQQLLTAGVAPE